MNRIVKYGLIKISIFIVGSFVVYGMFNNTLDLFGDSEEEILKVDCDYEGLRQATTFNYGGNEATLSIIKVSIDLGCSGVLDNSERIVIFSAEYSGLTEVVTKWKSFDTLKIIYSKSLQPIEMVDKVTYSDSTLNVTIQYEKK